MAVAVVESFKYDSMYMACPPGQNKSGRCIGLWPLGGSTV